MNKLLTLSLMVALSIALPACGGGGSGSTTRRPGGGRTSHAATRHRPPSCAQ